MEKEKDKYVIVRADRAGVFAGYLRAEIGDTVVLDESQCLFDWQGAARISELALCGTKEPEKCKFTVPISGHKIFGVIEILPCTKEAKENIQGVPWWRI